MVELRFLQLLQLLAKVCETKHTEYTLSFFFKQTGIDHPNVRFVFHLGLPMNLEEYVLYNWEYYVFTPNLGIIRRLVVQGEMVKRGCVCYFIGMCTDFVFLTSVLKF